MDAAAPQRRYIKCRAREIFNKIKDKGPQQVRAYRGWLLTFRYPAPRGYGTRGTLVGVYTKETRLRWIEADLLSFIEAMDTQK